MNNSDSNTRISGNNNVPKRQPNLVHQGLAPNPGPSRSHSPANPGDSPFDLSTYLAFPTANSGLGGLGQSPHTSEEVYKAFALGIKASQGDHVGSFKTPQVQPVQEITKPTSSSDTSTQAQSVKSDSEGQQSAMNTQNAQNNGSVQAVKMNKNSTQQPSTTIQSAIHDGSSLSPYGLDPSAFQTEVRFQLPAFLNPTSTTSSQAHGAEVWAGYNAHSAAMEGFQNVPRQYFGDFNDGGGNTGFGMGSRFFGGSADTATGMDFGTAVNGLASDGKWQSTMQMMSNQPGHNGLRPTLMSQQSQSDTGFAHTDGGGLTQWDNWSFQADSLKTSPGVFQYSADGSQNLGQVGGFKVQGTTPLVNNVKSDTSSNEASSDESAPKIQLTTGTNLTMPTSALLPSNHPASASFPSSSSMSIPPAMAHAGAPGNVKVADGAAGGIAHTADNIFASSSTSASAVAAQALANGPLGGLVQPGTFATQTPGGVNMPGLYSTTGFDMVSVLSKVAARRDPKSVLGPVDCSCSFVVVDIRKYDHPIVYSSPTFSMLTGYENREIVGRNCRFLQSPDAEIIKGSRRKYTDNEAVAHMKRMLGAGKECQASLINYRKGGTPFINLVTIVPIPWDTDEIVYHVGFQVDLVEQPNAILRNMRDGSYQVNYTVLNNPQPPLKPPPTKAAIEPPSIKTIGLKQELLDLIGPVRANAAAAIGGEEAGKAEWLKFVLEETDDFVHVLSLKGQFHYVSPSVSRVLEYEPEDLLNKHISDICHPSDIVPVMRELKDSSQTPQDGQPPKPFNLLFRIRRKYSGYIWLESSGRLHVEAGKSRKAVILTGRERCLPSIKWKTIDDHGGLGDCELWANLSFDGLILWASGTVDQVMGVQSEEVVGKSYYAFLPGGDNGAPSPDGSTACLAVQKAIAQAAQGLPRKGAVSVRHQLRGATGRMFEVTSTFYAAGCRGGATGITSPAAATPDSSDSEASADSSRSKIGTEVRPSHILMQVKMSGPQWPRRQNPLVNSSKENVFEEMDTTRGTSWQYEIHQLRIANRKLNEEVISARSAIAEQLGGGPDDEAKKKGKKRKMQQGSLDRGRANPLSLPINSRLGIPAPLMDHPAPLHQQTPGFGLAPGQLYKTW